MIDRSKPPIPQRAAQDDDITLPFRIVCERKRDSEDSLRPTIPMVPMVRGDLIRGDFSRSADASLSPKKDAHT